MSVFGPGPVPLAHRGGGKEVTENSRTALEHTRRLGYRVIETDVHLTADGVVVLQHDPRIDRTLNGSGLLGDMTWQQVALLRDGAGHRPVRLSEALSDYPDLVFNIDLKEDRVVGPALRTIAAAKAADRVCLAAFSEARLRVVRRIGAGTLATSLGPTETSNLVLSAGWPRSWQERFIAHRVPMPSGTGTGYALALQVPVTYRGVRIVTPRVLELAHRLGLVVHVWTIDEPTRMHHLLDMGVDGLITDRPTVLREVLAERGQWQSVSVATNGE